MYYCIILNSYMIYKKRPVSLKIFKIIKPIVFPVYQKFALADNPADKTRRLIEKAADILGTATFDDEDDE